MSSAHSLANMSEAGSYVGVGGSGGGRQERKGRGPASAALSVLTLFAPK